MFTGIIEDIGTIAAIRSIGGGIRLRIEAQEVMPDLHSDDSIAIDGVCLTAVACSEHWFEVEAVEETLAKTTIGKWHVGRKVNLERSLRVGDRLGGHFVLGHVDSIGKIIRIEERKSSWIYVIEIPKEFLRYVISVGSIAINGVSLTVARVEQEEVFISIIPHTFQNTTFQHFRVGDSVNVEFDMIGKYIEKLMNTANPELLSSITERRLKELGY
jgi:riboflavin synthase